jgi:hypothetical protein
MPLNIAARWFEKQMHKIAKTGAVYWLAAAFVLGFLSVGFGYWQVPYAKVSLPGTLYGPGLLLVIILAGAVRAFSNARLTATTLVVGATVPAAVLARVSVETLTDPTSHNLWPLELIIAAVVGVVCSLAGAVIGSLPSWLSKR